MLPMRSQVTRQDLRLFRRVIEEGSMVLTYYLCPEELQHLWEGNCPEGFPRTRERLIKNTIHETWNVL